jgi:predicted DNA-binding protein
MRPKQVNFQVDKELLEDIKVLAHRRSKTVSELIRLLIQDELEREAEKHIVFNN